ncbi:IclR family transcriptional regulator [Rhodococcus sp. OK302]|uniref:IclR family transcriptional regulator n=1 Tax=Rhodococcus sp. OK302 TaxID=1882769 RepID=UPI000B9420B6|nr:IclR family transcriptional regulator [Rhodococcus sp. OK302]OYD70803.1 IclR family transcriptional regulator [Rhodococcus sp. OK302]
MTTGSPSMIERMTLIMSVFDTDTSMLRLVDVTERTGLARSTTHRILEQLVGYGWLRHTGDFYLLGARSKELGAKVVNHSRLRTAAAPILHTLHAETGLVAHLGYLDGTDVVYLDKVGGQAFPRVPTRVGIRIPAHATALGKSVLSFWSPEQVDTLLPAKLSARTASTIVDRGSLHLELARIRARNGLAFDRQEVAFGIGCVAAALRAPTGVHAGFSLSGDLRPGVFERSAPVLLAAARRATEALFPDAPGDSVVREGNAAPESSRVLSWMLDMSRGTERL